MARQERNQRRGGGPPAEEPEPVHSPSLIYLTSVFFTWLLPGAGHWILGHRGRAVLLFSLLMGLFWWGQYLADFRAVNRSIHPVFFCGQIGNGLSTLVSESRWGARKRSFDSQRVARDLPPNLSTGIIFTSVSGLLNLLLVLHVADPRTWSAVNNDRKGNAEDEP